VVFNVARIVGDVDADTPMSGLIIVTRDWVDPIKNQ